MASLVIENEQVAQFRREFEGRTPTSDIQDEIKLVIEHLVDLWPDGKIILTFRVVCKNEAFKD